MMVNLKQSINDEENHMREMEKYTNPTVLFMDDFLKGKATPADLSYIYRIINTRYLQEKPMIISTEKSVEEILNFGEAELWRWQEKMWWCLMEIVITIG